jgi:hypothetical protein
MHSTSRRSLLPLTIALSLGFVLAACAGSPVEPSPLPTEPPPAVEPGVPEDPGAPGLGEDEAVEPQPGQQNTHPVALDALEARVENGVVLITARWTSGVEPCFVLDSVLVEKGDGTLDVTIVEGTSDPEAVCIMLAQAKHTVVAVDGLDAGTYTVRDTQGSAAPIEVVVP